MIIEWLHALTTPCPVKWRRMGYLHQAIGIDSRQARNRKAWKPHLENTRSFILDAAKGCARHRKVVLMGAAAVHDLPVKTLARMFDEVVLVDLFHLWPARWLAFTHNNIHLKVCDLTASLEAIYQGQVTLSEPDNFLDDDDVDLVVSANIASQLPLIPLSWLKMISAADDQTCQDIGRKIVSSHFEYLKKFRGSICLICDIERQTVDQTGVQISRQSALFDLPKPAYQARWKWDIAPSGEINKNRATSHIVIGAIMGQNSDKSNLENGN